ncbi:MAG: C39 family peptidase [Pseudohaliea sp.]
MVRQQRDFSCGTAALATVLTHYFLQPTSEAELLDALLTTAGSEGLLRQGVSLGALAGLAEARGFAARGVAVSPGALNALRAPAIAWLAPRGQPHFAVLRGISPDAVELADPARGNVRVPRAVFERDFLAEDGRGRLLLLAAPAGAPVAADYFGLRRPLPRLRPP